MLLYTCVPAAVTQLLLKQHVVCSVGPHGARPSNTHFSGAVTESSDNYSALDTDMTSVTDSTATTEDSSQSDQDSDAEANEVSDSADSCAATSRRRQPPPARDRTSQDIVRFVPCSMSLVLYHDALCCHQCCLLNFEPVSCCCHIRFGTRLGELGDNVFRAWVICPAGTFGGLHY